MVGAFRSSQSKHAASTIIAAGMTGVFTIIAASSFASLIFAGPLQPFAGNGIWLMLWTAFIVGILMALTSSLRGVVAIPQDRIAPIMAVLVAGVVSQMPNAIPVEQCRAAIASITLVSLLTGVVLYLVGRFKMGDLLQYIPYPVIGGFLAGSGWLLAVGALRVMVGHPITLAWLPEIFMPGLVLKWMPGLMFGSLLLVVMKRAAHPLVPATMLLAAIALFYVALALSGTPLETARAHGWLPVAVTSHDLARFPGYGPFADIPWTDLGRQFNIIGTILLTSVVSILLTASALELATRQEVDINQELRSAGLATSVASMGGGMVGFHSLSLSRLAHSMGADNRWVGALSGGLCGLALLVGPSLIGYLPQYVCGGLLFFLGLMFLWEWVVEARRSLNRVDRAVVLLILGVIGTLGYTQGIITGVVAAIILFIHNYSRVDVVTNTLSGAQLTSNVDRPMRFVRELKESGQAIYILKLQGFIFFGTASHLLEKIRARYANPKLPPLRFVVLDFRRVTGLDSSAIFSLRKAEQMGQKRGFVIILCHASAELVSELRYSEEQLDGNGSLRLYPDLDHGLEACENEMLKPASVSSPPQLRLVEQLNELWPKSVNPARLLPFLERQEFPAQAHLIIQGETSNGLYFIESGHVTARLEFTDGRTLRLRTMGPGTVVGEISLFLGGPRTASVVTNEPCVVYGLSPAGLERLEQEDPPLALAFHRFAVCLLAERLTNSTGTLRSVLE
jgi:sulfate permease, SulP family